MKPHVITWGLLVGLMLGLQPVLAQETTTKQESQIVITKTVKDADGSEVTITKRLDTEEALNDLLQTLQEKEALVEHGEHHPASEVEEEEMLFLFRRAGERSEEKLREMRIFMSSEHLPGSLERYYERDPCRVFIGVRTVKRYRVEQGVEVLSIVDGTPAEEAGLQRGDLILEMDGIAVNGTAELIEIRNEHQPGDKFRLKVLRGNEVLNVKARFKACEEEEEIAEEPEPATPEPGEQNAVHQLQLQKYQVFPNPSFGRVQLQFEAEAVPTTVQLADVTGKVVFTEQLNSFNGMYNREIDLEGATPGTIVVTVRQGDKVVAKKLLLLNRA